MRILMINHFPLEGSGSGTYTKNLACQLAKLGHEVVVILPENSTDYPQYPGVRLHPVFFTPDDAQLRSVLPETALPFNFPCFTTHPRSTLAFSDLDTAQMDAYLGAFTSAIDDELEQFAPDVIHGQHIWILPSLAANKGIPLVLTAHGTDLMGYEKWPQMRIYAQHAMQAARSVVCISADNERLVRDAFPDDAHKIVRMRNGYDPDVCKPMVLDRTEVLAQYGVPWNQEQLVFFAGKMTRFKGVDVLLEAIAHLTTSASHLGFVLAGDGELRAPLEARARELDLQTTWFIGNVPQLELARLYNIADVSVVPSRREPFGLVAVEAMACGTPVVASNEGGLPDFVSDAVGTLVAPEDPASLANGIIRTLERTRREPEWRSRIAAHALDNYSQEQIIHELVELYRTVMQA